MKRSWAAWAVAAAMVVTLACVYWLQQSRRPAEEQDEPEAAQFVPPAAPTLAVPAVVEETWTARLFFPAANDLLVAQEAPVTSASSPRARATGAVAALLTVVPEAPRVSVFPPEVKLGKLLLLEDGTVIVDLRTDPVVDPPQSGSTVEQLRIYAVVNTVLRNVEEAKRVVLLWNGVQRPTLAGHVDTGHALRLRADLEAS
ncbi:MAG: GerMN domain-containing protein [Thermoanaerobaculia bacterium]